MENKAEEIIKKRRQWLAENRIQDWNDSDTLFVIKEYASQQKPEIAWNNAVQIMDSKNSKELFCAFMAEELNSDESIESLVELVEKDFQVKALYQTCLKFSAHVNDLAESKVNELKTRIQPSDLQKENEILKQQILITFENANKEVERLKDALDKISTAPLPYNERESRTWIETARQIANEALNK